MAGASGFDSGGAGGGSKRFSGADPEQYKTFKSNMMASLLARDKKPYGDGPPQHDTTTWGPFVIKQLDGDAAEIFEEADIESEYAIADGHRKVFKELEDKFPQKNKVETKQGLMKLKREFRHEKGETMKATVGRFKEIIKKLKKNGNTYDDESLGDDFMHILGIDKQQRANILSVTGAKLALS